MHDPQHGVRWQRCSDAPPAAGRLAVSILLLRTVDVLSPTPGCSRLLLCRCAGAFLSPRGDVLGPLRVMWLFSPGLGAAFSVSQRFLLMSGFPPSSSPVDHFPFRVSAVVSSLRICVSPWSCFSKKLRRVSFQMGSCGPAKTGLVYGVRRGGASIFPRQIPSFSRTSLETPSFAPPNCFDVCAKNLPGCLC